MQLNLKQAPWYVQVALFGVVAVAAMAAYYFLYDSKVRAELKAKHQQLDTLRVEINRGRAAAQKLQEFQGEVADLQTRLDGLKAVLPEQKDVGDLLRRIQTLATQSNLEIRGFKPLPIVSKQMHAEWPISLDLEGTYHDLGLFFDKVSKVPRIINISSIKINGLDSGRQPAKRAGVDRIATIGAECLATTFVLIEGPVAPPADAKPGRPAKRTAPAKAPAPAR
jgi:type IV pilus assembly protein PilO